MFEAPKPPGFSNSPAKRHADSRANRPPIPSVYCEAAKLYRAQCLLKISEKPKNALRQESEKLEHTIAFQHQLLKKYAKRMIPRVAEMYGNELKKDEALLNSLKKVPTGKKAAKCAVKQLNSFIAENEFGIYRGEAMQTLGDYYLETRLDLE